MNEWLPTEAVIGGAHDPPVSCHLECSGGEGELYGVTALGFAHVAITAVADRLPEASRQAENTLASMIEDLRGRGENL